jgi:peptidoglycan/xylan/chitin deacetylase (PgdA/CDA1 family)
MMNVYLTFHGLGAPGPHVQPDEHPYWLPVAAFAEILKLVARCGSSATTHVTFDDGNKSDLELALPVLQRAGLRASFMILSDRIGSPNYLDADDILVLHKAGMTIGSHGADHVRWTTLANRELEDQISRSLSILTGIIGAPVRTVAAPFGAFDRRVLTVLRAQSIDRLLTSDGGPALPWSRIVPRNTIRIDTPLDEIRRLLISRYCEVRTAKAIARPWWRWIKQTSS